MTTDRLRQQIQFILELDQLKHVIRRSLLLDETRRENVAEHSWHLTLMALVLADYANAQVNLLQVLKMLIIHDTIEVYAGDTYVYDTAAYADKADREREAADQLFGLLPADQAAEFHTLWNEFEARETPEAKFAAALDRLMPLLHSYHIKGKAWRKNGITLDRVLDYNAHMQEGAETLWTFAQSLLDDAVAKGWLEVKV